MCPPSPNQNWKLRWKQTHRMPRRTHLHWQHIRTPALTRRVWAESTEIFLAARSADRSMFRSPDAGSARLVISCSAPLLVFLVGSGCCRRSLCRISGMQHKGSRRGIVLLMRGSYHSWCEVVVAGTLFLESEGFGFVASTASFRHRDDMILASAEKSRRLPAFSCDGTPRIHLSAILHILCLAASQLRRGL